MGRSSARYASGNKLCSVIPAEASIRYTALVEIVSVRGGYCVIRVRGMTSETSFTPNTYGYSEVRIKGAASVCELGSRAHSRFSYRTISMGTHNMVNSAATPNEIAAGEAKLVNASPKE